MKPSTRTTRPGGGGAEHGAGHHRHLEAAVFGEGVVGGEVRRGAGGGAGEDRALAGEAGVVEAGAAADERVERQAA